MEQLDALLQKLGAAPIWQKLAGLAGAVLLLIGGYYFFFLDDLQQDRAKMQTEQQNMLKEKAEYEARKKEYLAYRQEIAQLLEEQKDVLRLLPKNDDIEQFIEALQQQVELAGLTRQALVRDPSVPADLFIRLPVKVTLFGTYHQFMRFFKSMGEIPRIVNIEDLKLVPQQVARDSTDMQDVLKADFVTVAFQYLDRGTPAPAKAGAAGGMKPAAQAGGAK